jgi:hypothetical protein
MIPIGRHVSESFRGRVSTLRQKWTCSHHTLWHLSDGMSGRHEFFCDSLTPSRSTTAIESNKAEASLTSCSSPSNALMRFFAARKAAPWVESTPSRKPAPMKACFFYRWRTFPGTRVSKTTADTASPPNIRSIISRRKCGG